MTRLNDRVYGHMTDILEPSKGIYVFASYLENVYLETAVVKQLWVACLPSRPLVAVVHPDKELLYLWAHNHALQQKSNNFFFYTYLTTP